MIRCTKAIYGAHNGKFDYIEAMKIALRILAIVIMVFFGLFVLSAVAMLIEGKYGTAIVGFVFGLGGVFAGRALYKIKLKERPKKIKEPKQPTPRSSQQLVISIDTKKIAEKIEEKAQDHPKQKSRLDMPEIAIRGMLYQAMESIEGISTSSNIQVVNGRLDFLRTLLFKFCREYTYKGYRNLVASVEEKYRIDYYDKTFTDEQRDIILNPVPYLAQWDSFRDNSLLQCFLRHAQKQQAHINSLKTKKAKVNRINLTIDAANEVLEKLQSTETKDRIRQLILELGKMKQDLE